MKKFDLSIIDYILSYGCIGSLLFGWFFEAITRSGVYNLTIGLSICVILTMVILVSALAAMMREN